MAPMLGGSHLFGTSFVVSGAQSAWVSVHRRTNPYLPLPATKAGPGIPGFGSTRTWYRRIGLASSLIVLSVLVIFTDGFHSLSSPTLYGLLQTDKGGLTLPLSPAPLSGTSAAEQLVPFSPRLTLTPASDPHTAPRSTSASNPASMPGQGDAHRALSRAESTEDLKRLTLEETVRRVAAGNRENAVIVVETNEGAVHFLDNWMAHLVRTRLHHYALVSAHDRFSFDYVQEKWPGQAIFPKLEEASSAGFGDKTSEQVQVHSPAWLKLVKSKPFLVLTLLALNVSVLYSDVDVLITADPFPWFQDPQFDLFISLDWGQDWNPAQKEHRVWPYVHPLITSNALFPNMNAGLFFARPSEASIGLVRAWADRSKERKAEYNQPSFDAIAHQQLTEILQHQDEHKELPLWRVAVLPIFCFCPGFVSQQLANCLFWGNDIPRDCVTTLHFNFILKKRLKILCMAKGGYWIADTAAPPGQLQEARVEQDGSGTLLSIDRAALQKHAVSKAKDGVLHIAFLSEQAEVTPDGYFVKADMSRLGKFRRGLRVAGLTESTVFFAGDEVMFQQANEEQRGSAIVLSSSLGQPPTNNSGIMHKPDLLPFLLSHLIALNTSVCYNDLNTVWFRWPLPDWSEYDVLIGHPENRTDKIRMLLGPHSPTPDIWAVNDTHRRLANLDLLCVRPTPRAQSFLQAWQRAIKRETEGVQGRRTKWGEDIKVKEGRIVVPNPGVVPLTTSVKVLREALAGDPVKVGAPSRWLMPSAYWVRQWERAQSDRLNTTVAVLDTARMPDPAVILMFARGTELYEPEMITSR